MTIQDRHPGKESKRYSQQTWSAFKPNFGTAHQELKYVAEKTVVGAGFQSVHISQVLEVLANVLQLTDDDTEDTLFQMKNATSQSIKYCLN